MTKEERKRHSLIRKAVWPAHIYELRYVALPDSKEWAASVAFKDGNDKRFRFTSDGRLVNEADVGDARA